MANCHLKICARRALLMAPLLLAAACSQNAAPVDVLGQNIYGRSGTTDNAPRSYAAKRNHTPSKPDSDYKPYEPPPIYTNTKRETPVPQSTSNHASIQSVGVSDLPPPDAKKHAEEKHGEPKPVNLWTKKPRADEAAARPVEAKKETGSAVLSSTAPSSYMWPVNSHKVISGFGPKGAGKVNDGINIASSSGEPVWASADGEIVYVGNELKGYGNMVLIKHPGGKTTTYAHLNNATVDKYDRVKQGDIIGYVGSTGNVKKPQLHFAIHNGKTAVDPKKYLSTNLAGL